METLLIAEDSRSNFELLKASVGRSFIKVLHARNGIEAVEFCKNDTGIEMVLMDISMPEMNGYDATRIIRSARPDLPVIALTAYINDETEVMLRHSGFNAFLMKPFQLSELMALITKYKKGESQSSITGQ